MTNPFSNPFAEEPKPDSSANGAYPYPGLPQQNNAPSPYLGHQNLQQKPIMPPAIIAVTVALSVFTLVTLGMSLFGAGSAAGSAGVGVIFTLLNVVALGMLIFAPGKGAQITVTGLCAFWSLGIITIVITGPMIAGLWIASSRDYFTQSDYYRQAKVAAKGL